MGFGVARINVFCDYKDCRSYEELELTDVAGGWDGRNIDDDLEARGWTIVDDSTRYCENHKDENDEDDSDDN